MAISSEFKDVAADYSYMKSADFGLSEELVRKVSESKDEPEWMLEMRLDSLKIFNAKAMPSFGPDLSGLDLSQICYFVDSGEVAVESWDEMSDEVRDVYEKLGIPEAERSVLAGVGAQYESETVYHSLKEKWMELGIIFLDMDEAVKTHPEIVKEHFMKCIPANDHKFAALHGAVWSGGTFLYVPKGVEVTEPLQAYFRMNAPGMGQFEHTMIIIEDEASAHYIEGCSAPKFGKNGLHAGCVEVFVGKNAQFRYSSVENWSKDTYNLNTKRAWVDADSRMEWIGGNLGSGVTMLYPCSILRGEGASCDHLGVAFAGEGQHQDVGAKVIHAASKTSSRVVSKSLSKDGGNSTYRGLINVIPGAEDCNVSVECDALILDEKSISDTFPVMNIGNNTTFVSHEASVGKLDEDDIFYLESRGLSRDHATSMIVNGFMDPIVRALPLEYAVEMNRLIELEMER